MRAFPDTNVLISAAVARGLCADLLRLLDTEHDMIIGQVVLDEFVRVLSGRMKFPRDLVDEWSAFLRAHEVVAKPTTPSKLQVRDPADRWVLASAIAGRADVLITGDRDLLDIAAQSPIPIRDPRTFWNELRRGPRRD